ncbi:hypothetical protein QFC20_005705 [Naganishia adeliensis]|uniref:Uncharacterized protein n=1 Tax=Naganishia adeliensis TaxID=92952 RepID=A0ACC2VK17_9TREE|nr:hypothetical protein QFC20_005705 [Naganishia adeliensis]
MAIGGKNQFANSRSSMLRTRRETLQAEVAELTNRLGDVDAQAIVRDHIEMLHAYNEIK